MEVFELFAEVGGLEILHPGGYELTDALARRVKIGPEHKVLDVASGVGLAACFLAEKYGCQVTGTDSSVRMVELAERNAARKGLQGKVNFVRTEGWTVPFPENTFDVGLCECSMGMCPAKPSLLSKMIRALKAGGKVAIHDMTWLDLGVEENVRTNIYKKIQTSPESEEDWAAIFRSAGLIDVEVEPCNELIHQFVHDVKKQVSARKRLSMITTAFVRGGFSGLREIIQFMTEFESAVKNNRIGYAIVVGTKPKN
ncbi:MAG: class I SAM-dependent methyltransferase [Candidatus Bathyarchaeia archaeon]